MHSDDPIVHALWSEGEEQAYPTTILLLLPSAEEASLDSTWLGFQWTSTISTLQTEIRLYVFSKGSQFTQF